MASLAVFIHSGEVAWGAALPLMLGSALGFAGTGAQCPSVDLPTVDCCLGPRAPRNDIGLASAWDAHDAGLMATPMSSDVGLAGLAFQYGH